MQFCVDDSSLQKEEEEVVLSVEREGTPWVCPEPFMEGAIAMRTRENEVKGNK